MRTGRSRSPVVAVHVVWNDALIGSAHLSHDDDFDPWLDLARDGAHGCAVKIRAGRARFVFAPDPRSAVEGPNGSLSFESLVDEQLVEPMHDGSFTIAMEPGLVYRTVRNDIVVTAEIVAAPPRLVPPRRLAKCAIYLSLVITALALGGGLLAANPTDDEQIEPLPRVAEQERLGALLARVATELPPPERRARFVHRRPPQVADYRVVVCTRSSCSFPAPSQLSDVPWPWAWPEGDLWRWPEDGVHLSMSAWTSGFDAPMPPTRACLTPRAFSFEGALPRSAVMRAVNRQATQIRCPVNEHPRMIIATVRFVIGPDGSVMGAAATSTNALAREAARQVRGWVFPSPEGGTFAFVTYSFRIDERLLFARAS